MPSKLIIYLEKILKKTNLSGFSEEKVKIFM